MNDVTVYQLEDVWGESYDEPFTFFESDDPNAEVGSFVVEPGERVPETGAASHDGDEITVVLAGEIDLVVASERATVDPETVTVIPEGTPHYGENTGDEPVRLVYTILGER